ncbi:MAG: MMPL family transporter [Demequina sp.]|jgi:RND superfamily putative drug exporter|nr:MMPL family transporter [Demequina sp.]
MKAIARFSTGRPLAVLLGWIVLVIGLQALVAAVGQDIRDTYALKDSDSQSALDTLRASFPAAAGDTDTVAFKVTSGSITEAQGEIEAVLADIAKVDHVTGVVSPFAPDAVGQVSPSGTIAIATIHYDDQAYNLPLEDVEKVGAIVAAANSDELTVGVAGQPASRLTNPTVGVGEFIGLAIAGVILFIAFGSLMAVTVPLISAIVALTGALAALSLFSNLDPQSTSSPLLAVLLGLGIGIDYALFIVNRHRLGLKAGREVRDSVRASVTTSGRAVVFAGLTVFIALAGMFVPQIHFLSSLAIAAAITVAFSVAASITLVPALLTLYGHRVLSRRERAHLAETGFVPDAVPKPGRFANLVERRPLVTSLAALAVLGLLAIPAFSLRLGNADQGNDPVGATTRTAYDIVAEGFGPGVNGTLVVVAKGDDLTGLATKIGGDSDVASVQGPIPNGDGSAQMLVVVPKTSPQDVATEHLVERVRDTYIPQADVAAHVGGSVAGQLDFTDAIADSLPLFFAIVIGLSMVVLTVAFRSVTLPLVGAAMNLLSALAAFGVIVAVFQWGWGHSLIGIGEGGPVEPFAPLILFALLFGLSMDYQVFLVSRIAELYHGTKDNAVAVRRGLAEVSRVIIAAASIMVVVFGSFVSSDSRIMKLLGLGLAVAVFVDAFIVRVVLVPAIMRLLGRANWWMPAWLDRILPHLDIDDNASAGDGHAVASQGVGQESELVEA